MLALRAGHQVMLDGVVVGDGRMEMDQSLLSGGLSPDLKRPVDPVYSGSCCVSGAAR